MEWRYGYSLLNTKKVLADAALLVPPAQNTPISLTADASDRAIGAALEQFVVRGWQPLAFFSKKLQPPEKNIVLLIGSCLPSTLVLDISGTSWRVGSLQLTLTTSRSSFAWPRYLTLGQVVSSISFLIHWNLPQTSSTSQENTTQLQTLYRELPLTTSSRESTIAPWPQTNARILRYNPKKLLHQVWNFTMSHLVALQFSATCRQAIPGLLFLSTGDARFSTLYMAYPTRTYMYTPQGN